MISDGSAVLNPAEVSAPVSDSFLDKVAGAGVGLLDNIPFGMTATEALLSGMTGVHPKVIDQAVSGLRKDHPGYHLAGAITGILGGAAVNGTSILANSLYGALQSTGDIAKKALIDPLIAEDPAAIEKAIVQIGGEALLRGATAGVVKKIPALIGKAGDAFVDAAPGVANFVQKQGAFFGGALGFAKNIPASIATGNPLPAILGGVKGAYQGEIGKTAIESGIQRMVTSVNKFNNLMDGSIGHLVSSAADSAAPAIARTPLSEWDTISNDIFSHNSDAQQMYLTDHLKDHPPSVVQGAQIRSMTAVQFMKAQFAANVAARAGKTPLPYDDPPQPTDTQKAKVLNAYDAIRHPLTVLQNPSPEGFAAVKAVYPSLLQAMSQAVLNKVAETPTMPYAARNRVAAVLGQPLDSSQTPEFGAQMSDMYKAQATQEAKKQGKPQQGSARGQKAIEQSQKAILTTAQKIQSEN